LKILFGGNLMNLKVFVFCLLIGLALALPTQAATVWWDGTTGDYADPLNWNTDTFPAVGDTAVIANGGTSVIDATAPTAVKYLLVGAAPVAGFPGEGFTAGPGNLIQNSQTLTVTDQVFVTYSTSSSGRSFYTMNGGTLNIAPDAAVVGYLRVGQGVDAEGVMTISGDSVVNVNGSTAGYIRVGESIDSVGVIRQSGNAVVTLKSAIFLGMNQPSAYGYYGISGGSLTSHSYAQEQNIGQTGIGLFQQSGGSVTVATRTWIGNTASAFGVVNLSGGTYHNNGSSARNVVGNSGMGIINLSGTGVYSTNSDAWIGLASGGTGVINVGAIGAGGGTLYTTGMLRKTGVTGQINFHGGTVKAKIDNPNYMNSSAFGAADSPVDAYVYSEGGIIDTNGKNIIITNPLKAPTGFGVGNIAIGGNMSNYVESPAVRITGGGGAGATAVATINSNGVLTGISITNPGVNYTSAPTVEIRGGKKYSWEWATATAILDSGNLSGGITKVGAGTLTLGGVNTYTGLTDVQVGTLALTGSLAGGANVASGATLKGTGSIAGAVVAAGSVQPGMSIGTLTVSGNATISGSLDVEYNSSTDQIDMLAVSGQLDLSGGTISFSDIAATSVPLDQPAYVFATYGTLVGSTPTVTGLPAGYTVNYAYNGNSIALVPEPSTLALLALGLIGMAAYLRRRG
jgi:fibronectin-binding autotransporter adhesin